MTGLLDKITGRVKKTVGEVAEHEPTRREGAREERKGEAAEEAEAAEHEAVRRRQEQANLERKT